MERGSVGLGLETFSLLRISGEINPTEALAHFREGLAIAAQPRCMRSDILKPIITKMGYLRFAEFVLSNTCVDFHSYKCVESDYFRTGDDT